MSACTYRSVKMRSSAFLTIHHEVARRSVFVLAWKRSQVLMQQPMMQL
jgi:hypothetical protein